MIPCDSTRRRRPFSDGDNRSISRRASERGTLQPAGGRAIGQSLERARDHRTTTIVRSSIFRSFVRSVVRVLLLTTLGEKKRNLTQVPSLALNDLGPGSNLPPVALDLGFSFPPFFFCHLPPSRPTQPLGTWVSSPTFLPPFVPLLQYQPNPLPFIHIPLWYQSLLFICFIHFFGKNSGLDKFAILTYPSQCFVLEKFCSFF